MTTSLPLLVRGGCPHDCPDTCAWTVRVEDGRAVEMRGDPDHPFTAGGLCAKVDHYLDSRTYNPDRILHPLRRTGPKGSGQFERVSWDDALADIAARLRTIFAESGGEALLPYSYVGNQGMVNGLLMQHRFFGALGASRLERTICGDNAATGIAATYGTSDGIDPEELVHSRFVILWGTNTITTNLHLWPFVRRARDAGATVVVIDPVRTRTAAAADWHVRPFPGTDAALALGMARVIVDEGLHDQEWLDRHAAGFPQLVERLADYPLDRVAEITRLPAAEIVQLARGFATTRPAVIRTLIGMDHRESAAQTFRAISCLPALTGAWRDRGGGLLYTMGRTLMGALNRSPFAVPQPDPAPRTVSMMQLGRALTDPAMDPPVRALLVYSSNPAAITPNQNLVHAGLAREDLFTVVHEQLPTDTTRYADYVLPATTQVEQLDLLYNWGTAYVTLNQPAIAPCGEAVTNSELFRRLARALDLDAPEVFEPEEAVIRRLLDSDHPALAGITYEYLLEHGWEKLHLPEHGRPYAEGGFPTKSGKCELYSTAAERAGFDPLPAYVPPAESDAADPGLAARYPLSLVSPKTALHFLNSSYAGVPRALRAEKEPRLDLSAADAELRGIADGDVVRVFNDRGQMELRARVGDLVRPGVVAIPAGWWPKHTRGGRSVNALTSDRVAAWGRGSAFHDTLVEVALVAADRPERPAADLAASAAGLG